jgi:hypothetical protein
MVYGFEAILPIDLEYGSPRLKAYNKQTNKVAQENAVNQQRRLETWPSSTQQGTSRSVNAIMTSTYVKGTCKSATLSSIDGKATKGATS